jgi:hypothetical protein
VIVYVPLPELRLYWSFNAGGVTVPALPDPGVIEIVEIEGFAVALVAPE